MGNIKGGTKLKHTIQGFSQEYAITLKKKVKVKQRGEEKEKEIKIDIEDLVIFRWIINNYQIDKPINIDFERLISDLPLLRIKERAFRERLQKMCELGLLKKLSNSTDSADIVNLLKNKNMRGLGVGSSTCQWCGVNTSVLHEHHYPIPKSKGGTETVAICPNCHHEFHSMSDIPEYKVNTEILADFDKGDK